MLKGSRRRKHSGMGDGRVNPKVIDELRTAFSESSLLINVDLVEWANLKVDFRRIIEETATTIQTAI